MYQEDFLSLLGRGGVRAAPYAALAAVGAAYRTASETIPK